MLNIHIQNIITDTVEYSDNKGLLGKLTASRTTLQLTELSWINWYYKEFACFYLSILHPFYA